MAASEVTAGLLRAGGGGAPTGSSFCAHTTTAARAAEAWRGLADSTAWPPMAAFWAREACMVCVIRLHASDGMRGQPRWRF